MDVLTQSSLLVALTSFALGASTLARNVRNKLFITFAVLCGAISVWAFSFFMERIWGGDGVYYRFHLLLNVWLAPVALIFIRVMVRIQDRFSRRLLDASVILALLLSMVLMLRFEQLPGMLLLMYFAPGLVVAQIFHLMWIDRKLRRGIKLLPKLPTVGFSRRNLIYLGGLAVLATSVMDHVPWLGKAIPAIGNLGLTVYLFFISQAISHQRLLNFGALFSRFLVLITVALILALIYSLLVAWIQDSPGLFFLNSFIASFLIITLLDPLRAMTRYFTQRLLTQKHRRLEQILREAQRKLAGILDPGSLFQAILTAVEQTLQPQRAALFILRSDGTQYRRVRAIGDDPQTEPLREVLASHHLLQYCERLRRRGELPVLLDQMLEGEIDRAAGRDQREYYAGLLQGLKALECNLLIPLFDAGKILGFVTLYAPVPPEPWGNSWGLLQIIYPYFEQAARTLRNMEVYVRQRERERLATLGVMAAGLAHEIRNPLGAIKGAVQYLDPSADRPESRFLSVILEEVDRLNRVVTRFLDYSKPHSTELVPIDVSTLARKTVDLLRPAIKAGTQLEFDPGESESHPPARVLGAPEQIQQVLMNLIQNSVNALEGRESGKVKVNVAVTGNGEGREVHVIVEDNGPGIRKEHVDKLFIPFFTTSPGGTGLGLSICQKIIEGHNGRIDVVSEEGRFARFSVILPCFPDEASRGLRDGAKVDFEMRLR